MKRDIINNWFKMLNVKHLEDFSVEQLACLYDELYLSYIGSASQIFEECNDAERTEFRKALLNSINNDKQLEIFAVSNEGIKDVQDIAFGIKLFDVSNILAHQLI